MENQNVKRKKMKPKFLKRKTSNQYYEKEEKERVVMCDCFTPKREPFGSHYNKIESPGLRNWW